MNCPYCKRYFSKKSLVLDHMENNHYEMLRGSDMDASQLLYYSTHNTINGKCMCGCGRITEWNFKTGKPFKVSNDPTCRERLSHKAETNLYNATGLTKQSMMSNMEHQKAMQEKRPTAGKYKFADGGEVSYLSKLEHNFLQFCDKIMDLNSSMIQDSPETIQYYDSQDKRDREYMPDYYLPDYNLLVEIKDGGDHPNTNPMFIKETKYKVKMKDDAMRKQNKYNFIKIVDKNYGPFMETLFKIVELGRDDSPKKNAVIVINETACTETPINEDTNIKHCDFYLVVTSVPGTNLVETVSISEDFDFSKLYTVSDDTIEIKTPDDPQYIDTDVTIYRYIGEPEKVPDVMKQCKDYVGVSDQMYGQLTMLHILENAGIEYVIGDQSSNNHHRMDFIKKSKYERVI